MFTSSFTNVFIHNYLSSREEKIEKILWLSCCCNKCSVAARTHLKKKLCVRQQQWWWSIRKVAIVSHQQKDKKSKRNITVRCFYHLIHSPILYLHLPFAIQVISILKTHFALSLTHSLAYSLPTIAVCWRVIFGVFKW